MPSGRRRSLSLSLSLLKGQMQLQSSTAAASSSLPHLHHYDGATKLRSLRVRFHSLTPFSIFLICHFHCKLIFHARNTIGSDEEEEIVFRFIHLKTFSATLLEVKMVLHWHTPLLSSITVSNELLQVA